MSYDAALGWLYDRGRFGRKPGLERIARLLDALGIEAPPTVVSVAGTNGKGTVASLVATALTADGRRTGRYVSPHVHRFTERIAVDGVEIGRDRVAERIETVRSIVDDGLEATFFEIATALALDHFDREGCDAAVLEVGLGGRLDATNVVDADLAVIAEVGPDHLDVIGPTLADAARDKAGIVGPGADVVAADRPPLPDVLAERCRAVGAELTLVDEADVAERTIDGWTFDLEGRQVPTRLVGDHHAINVALAAGAADALDVPRDTFVASTAGVDLPARFDVLADDPLVADGAHNVPAAEALAAAWQALELPSATLVLGLIAGKDAEGIVDALSPISSTVLATAPDIPRRYPADELETILADRGLDHRTVPSTRAALEIASGATLATGSFFTAGEAIRTVEDGDHDPLIAL